ncbi:MAG TPA: SDR family oxidoreductase [Alphaproteobacteria bacterium]|nr:SDR family oxidoreductase [Alphaproteobacteria bacterium]
MTDYKNLFDLAGKAAVVTGSTKGIGRAIAEAYAAFGARVVISSRKPDKCDEVRDAINASGGDAISIPCNMSRMEDIDNLVATATKALGKIDILVCNAAVNPHFGPIASIPEEAFDKVMDTNVKNNLWLCNKVIPQMAERKDGAVIIVSSVGGFKGHAMIGTYNISKAADMQIARNLAVEWGPSNIRVNCICPAVVKTDMARALWEDPVVQQAASEIYPLRRLGEPQDIAGIAVYLASQAGAWTTGQSFIIDGGILSTGAGA